MTLGGEGSIIHADGATYAIPAVRPTAIVDPTGCGDAYRAGPAVRHRATAGTGRRRGNLASVMGSIKIASRGGQNHALDRDTIASRYRERSANDRASRSLKSYAAHRHGEAR